MISYEERKKVVDSMRPNAWYPFFGKAIEEADEMVKLYMLESKVVAGVKFYKVLLKWE